MSRPRTDGDPLWYKDAIIYEVNLKGFRDSNRDGVGDFPGLTEKLDYIQDLGVTCVWVLPFYPSPLKDDGYDISDYRKVLPAYGTLTDFKRFLKAAHERGLRVLTELVIDHTSDQHPWFQAARKAPRASSKRDWYVWSDDLEKYKDARIIFTDTEKSNWAWDETAKQYYWHRFFSHQPNLNFDSPQVRRGVQKVMEYWLDLGVDALRLDAIPYLYQREGTNCENLPEVHRFLKEMRSGLDRRYRERFFLAEANQWPADVLEYFGDGDECHMAYHFPLMPRLYMAIARENRHPIVEIMRNTPQIPDVCQWAIFLRNHDELTLEMVTDEERDYMYAEYARDPRMKCNVGIRRRLAPLMNFNRPAIELMNNLLLTLPGTPVIYYGDEIGMSDNIYLGDRNGVRTPMQWSLDRNAGFSEADAAQLYAPILVDPFGGWPAVTVEAQQRSAGSLLNWMRKLISLRRRHQAFSRGSFQVLEPENQKVLAYVRQYRDETMLVVSNLSRMVQPVTLDLSAWRGRVPVEMFGRTPLPPVGDAPYFLTLAPYGFLWLKLEELHALDEAWRAADLKIPSADRPPVLALEAPVAGAFAGLASRKIEQALVLPYIKRQPWWAGGDRAVESVRLIERIPLAPPHAGAAVFLAFVLVRFREGDDQTYSMPLEVRTGEVARLPASQVGARVIGVLECADGPAVLSDAVEAPEFARAMVSRVGESGHLPAQDGRINFRRTAVFDELTDAVQAGAHDVHAAVNEQTNTTVFVKNRLVLKMFRLLAPGLSPEIEMAQHLTETVACSATPRAAGWAVYRRRDGTELALALAQEFVENEGDAWTWTADYLGQLYEDVLAGDRFAPGTRELDARVVELAGTYVDLATMLGKRTAELHRALAESSQSFAFFPEPVTAADRRRWFTATTTLARDVLERLSDLAPVRPELAPLIGQLTGARKELRAALLRLKAAPLKTARTRVHGDFHLGQVLVVRGDVRIIDFEGRTDRPVNGRREKEIPLVDVAAMRRSFQYVSQVPLDRAAEGRAKDLEYLREVAAAWTALVGARFVDGYQIAAAGSPGHPDQRQLFDAVLRALEIEKALRELDFEMRHRPHWVHIPLRGLLKLIRH